MHAGLALDRLQQHRGSVRVHGRAQRLGLGRDGAKARDERREGCLLGLLRGRGERAVRAPVKRAVDDHDVPLRACLAHELDRRLVGLGAGVAEEHAPPEARLRQPLREAHRGLGVVEVADVHQPPGLLAHGRHDARVAVADTGHRDPAEEVQVLVALGIPQARADTAHELDGQARVGVHQALGLDPLKLGEAHGAAPIFVPIPRR